MEVLNPINEIKLISMRSMVDLALGAPEVGAVNFNVLHSLLHAILAKLEMGDNPVDIAVEENKTPASKSKLPVIPVSTIPYHGLQDRIKILENQISDLNSLPSNKDILNTILDNNTKDQAKSDNQRLVSDLWQTINIRKKVNANEEGIDRLSSMVDSILNEMKQLKSENETMKKQLEDLSGLKGMGDKVDGLQNEIADLLDQFNKLKDILAEYPPPDAFKNIVTWDGLEKALKGIKDDMDDLRKPTERVVVNMATEVEHVILEVNRLVELGQITPNVAKDEDEIMFNLKIPLKDAQSDFKSDKLKTIIWKLIPKTEDTKDRITYADELELNVPLTKWQLLQAGVINVPNQEILEGIDHFVIDIPIRPMSRPASQISSPGPSEVCAEMLEKLGILTTAHDLLDKRVVVLEEEMPNKADKKDLENLKIPDDLLKTIALLKAQMESLMASKNRDGEALARIRDILNALQDKMNAVNDTLDKLNGEHKDLLNQLEELFGITKDHETRKADLGYIEGLLRTKADKSLLDTKVNFSLFDETAGNLHSLIDDVLKKLLAAEEELRNLLRSLASDVNGKVDKDDLNALKEWIEKRLRALAEKLKHLRGGDVTEDDAAGLRKQLLQHFHCISCDRPLDIMTHGINYGNGLPEPKGLPPSKSLRPYTTFELDAIRQHSKNFQDVRVINPKYVSYGADIVDVYQTPRPCGGSHTTSYPQKKMVRLGNMNNSFIDEELHTRTLKEEADLTGADGHIYKGRIDRSQTTMINNNNYIEQPSNDKLPPVTASQRSQTIVNNNFTPRGAFVTSRPKSAVKITPRHSSSAGPSRPSSARVILQEPDSRPTSPVPQVNENSIQESSDELMQVTNNFNQMSNNETIITSESFNLEILNQSENEPKSGVDEAVAL